VVVTESDCGEGSAAVHGPAHCVPARMCAVRVPRSDLRAPVLRVQRPGHCATDRRVEGIAPTEPYPHDFSFANTADLQSVYFCVVAAATATATAVIARIISYTMHVVIMIMLQEIGTAVLNRAKQLVGVTVLLCVLVYVYAVISFVFFRNQDVSFSGLVRMHSCY
jgi:hypothetical protein